MKNVRVALNAGIVMEDLGDQVLVTSMSTSEVISLGGRPAEIVRGLVSQKQVRLLAGEGINQLEALGVVNVEREHSGLSRRQALIAGGASIAGAVSFLSLPSAASASSFSCPQVSGGLNALRRDTRDGVEMWRLNMSNDFGPFGTYWVEIFESANGTVRGSSLGFNEVEIDYFTPGDPSFGIDGFVEQSKFRPLDARWAIAVLYSDESKRCLVGEDALDTDD